jgi:hypothetical protein
MKKFLLAAFTVFSIALSAFYSGFFFPDPLEFGTADINFKNAPLVLQLILVGVPLLYATVVILGGLLWKGTISASALALVVASSTLALLLAYPVLSEIVYTRKLQRNPAEFHPFLQLPPPQISLHSQKRSPRVIFLGGSTTAWRNSSSQSWPEMSATFSDVDFEVVNAAREWYTSLHSLHQYLTRFRDSSADIIVVTHAINDLLINADFGQFSSGPFRGDYGHFLGPVRDLVTPRTLTHSIIDIKDRFWFHRPRTLVDTNEFPGLKSFRQNFISLAQVAALDGSKILFLSQPHLYFQELPEYERSKLYMLKVEAAGRGKAWSFDTALRGMQAYNQTTEAVAIEIGGEFFDLEPHLPKSLEFFKDDVHYTDAAYPIIAEQVGRKIGQMLLSHQAP